MIISVTWLCRTNASLERIGDSFLDLGPLKIPLGQKMNRANFIQIFFFSNNFLNQNKSVAIATKIDPGINGLIIRPIILNASPWDADQIGLELTRVKSFFSALWVELEYSALILAEGCPIYSTLEVENRGRESPRTHTSSSLHHWRRYYCTPEGKKRVIIKKKYSKSKIIIA